MEGEAEKAFDQELANARERDQQQGRRRSFEELAAEVLHREPARPHPLAYAFLGSFAELGRSADSSLSQVEMRAWLEDPDHRVADPGRREAYRYLWRVLDAETATAIRESLRKVSGKD